MIRYYWQIGDKISHATLAPDELPITASRYLAEHGYDELVKPLTWHEWQSGKYRFLWWCEPEDKPWWPRG